MPSSIARATARSRSATLPRINSPPMFPQPKPRADTRSPVPPSDRCSISHLLLLICGPRTAHGSFYAPTSAVNRAGTNFPLDGGFAGRDKRGHSMSRFPVITPPALADLRARIGRPVPRPEPYIEVATRDAVRHWAAGSRDRNSPAQTEEIAGAYRGEQLRGGTPRRAGDGQLGDAPPAAVKGPLTATPVTAFIQGSGSLYIRAHAAAFDLCARHPALGIPNAF